MNNNIIALTRKVVRPFAFLLFTRVKVSALRQSLLLIGIIFASYQVYYCLDQTRSRRGRGGGARRVKRHMRLLNLLLQHCIKLVTHFLIWNWEVKWLLQNTITMAPNFRGQKIIFVIFCEIQITACANYSGQFTKFSFTKM